MREMEGVWFQVTEETEFLLAAETAMVLGFHSGSQEFYGCGNRTRGGKALSILNFFQNKELV